MRRPSSRSPATSPPDPTRREDPPAGPLGTDPSHDGVAAVARRAFTVRLPGSRTLSLGRATAVMGVLNVTPDSFHDGGRYATADDAVRRGIEIVEAGAAIVDIGGESSRPGAEPVDAEEEARRVVPVVERLRRESDTILSVDTVKPAVARQALDAGADLINDISALSDPEMPREIERGGAAVVLMHMRGTPRTMQSDTRYDDLVGTVRGFLEQAVDRATAAGIADDKILLDPGIGFGKSAAGNLELIRRLPDFAAIGLPVVVGASRKSFIGSLLGVPVEERLEGSLASAALAAWLGAHVVRAHDVIETVRVVRLVDAVRAG